MHKKIFQFNFFSSLSVLLVSLILICGVLFDYFEVQILKELKSEANYIASAIENEGIAYINNFSDEEKRITLIDTNGSVLADTAANATELDNHSEREEIREAFQTGSGTSTRYSSTLMQKTLYYATKMRDGTVLRISTTQKSVIIILLGLLQPLIAIVIIVMLVSFFLSQKISKTIIKPINALDLENPSNNETYEELSPLLKKIAAQKKRIADQIKEANQKQEEFKLITENMREGLLMIDNQANVLTYNPAVLKLLKIDSIPSGSALMLNRTKGFRYVIEKALLGESAESDITLEEYVYHLIASPVYEHSKIIGAVIVILDVTESAKREQLRREFTSNISHELKTPLTSILGFAEIMKTGGTPEETVVDFSASIYEEAQRLICLVNDIMKISELDENSTLPETENVDIYSLAKEVIQRLKPLADKQNISLHLTGQTAIVPGVRKILDEMFYNLCDNAIRYNKENGTVDIIISHDEEKAEITVKDTGIGIPFSEQNRVFERFYRVDKSHSKQTDGTGLGLAIVKHGAICHNAEIQLESIEAHGTNITIRFPL